MSLLLPESWPLEPFTPPVLELVAPKLVRLNMPNQFAFKPLEPSLNLPTTCKRDRLERCMDLLLRGLERMGLL